MCVEQRLKSVFVSAQSEQSISFPPEETLEPWLPIEHPLKTQISLRMGAGWSESSMDAHANWYLLPSASSGIIPSSLLSLHKQLSEQNGVTL